MKKRYRILKRVSVILILLALFTKMHAQKVQYTQYHHILTHSYEQLLPVYKNLNKILNTEINAEETSQEDYTIIKIPFRIEHHKTLLIGIFTLGAFAICFFILYPLFLYFRESKRKRATQRELIREKELLSLSLEKSDIYAWKYVESTNTFSCDKEFFEHLDMPFRTFTLQEMTEAIHPEDRTDVLTTFFRVKSQEDSKAHTQCRCNFNGKGYIWYELRYVNPTKAMAETASIIGLVTNVQHFKDKEEELMKAKDLAIEAELKQSFLANMSHEIRTPLNAIVGFSNLLVSEDDLSDDEKADFINTINSNCELLLKLINDILELSRIESGKMAFSFSTCNLNSWIDNMYMTHSLLIPKEIEFIKEVPDATFFIHTDVNRLSQIITNFLNNAAKFTKSGFIKLGYEIDFSNYEISIYVEDTGKGIPKEEQRMIFERFYKQDEFVQGTGLGLSITKNIVDLMGGTIALTSEPGKGSEFIVTLCFTRSGQKAEPKQLPQLEGLRALVADDDTNTCLNVSTMLSKIGMRPEWTISGTLGRYPFS